VATPSPAESVESTGQLIAQERMELDYTDNDGELRRARVNFRLISPEGLRAPVRKQAQDSEDDKPTARSQQDNADPFAAEYTLEGSRLVEPAYSLEDLIYLREIHSELGSVVDAMVQNTVGFGHLLRPVEMPKEIRDKHEREIAAERAKLRAFFEVCNPKLSFREIRKRVAHDKYQTGNGYMETIPNVRGDIAALAHAPSVTMRITKPDDEWTKTTLRRVLPEEDFAVEEVEVLTKFRRFVQRVYNRTTYFKEAGDPRVICKSDGSVAADDLPLAERATEIIHFPIYHPRMADTYGIHLHAGNTLGIYGSRASEEANFVTLKCNNIPSVLLMVENGTLTKGSVARIQEFINRVKAGDLNYSNVLVIDAEPSEEGAPAPSAMRIKAVPLTNAQRTDALWLQYDKRNAEKTRAVYRIPPIFTGRVEEYNRATAAISRALADEQVFGPERDDNDWRINQFVLKPMGVKYHRLVSRTPNVTDNSELIKLMGIAERSGGMTPRRADAIMRDVFGDSIGPMPEGIPLDKPFSITFAEAQKTGQVSGGDELAKALTTVAKARAGVERRIDGYLDGDDEEDGDEG
jgi:PBSX family phage portal protein